MHIEARSIVFLAVLLFAMSAFAQKRDLGDKVSVQEIAPGVWLHRSTSVLGDFGPVESNGLVLAGKGESVLIDTPATVSQTVRILGWAESELHRPVRYAIFTHAHSDRIGGISALLARDIKTFALPRTIELAQKDGYPAPTAPLPADAGISVGGLKLHVFYPGAGHSADNIVVWLPSSKVLFGGCFVKAAEATGMGNTAEADLPSWERGTLELIRRYGKANIVVPGHGAVAGPALLEHTLRLIRQNKHLG
jgi:metallo-beta-lactamase class B